MVEQVKRCMFIRGHRTSAICRSVLRDMHALKKPQAIMLAKRNRLLPFEDDSRLEFLAHKNDASLFVVANHTKKRPHNLVLGRMYDGHVLDMMELGVLAYADDEVLQHQLQSGPHS